MREQPTSTRRALRMHDALLVSVIRDQAGDLWKGVLEGVQNSIDAEASRIDITVDETRVVISDDGRGFRSMREVEDWFETFGTPHEDGDAVFGRFRMGRGQLFNFGVTTYRTGEFQFVVDIEAGGLSYELTTGLENHPGCEVTIDLYTPQLSNQIFHLVAEIKRAVKYVDTEIFLNGDLITSSPASLKWNHEDDDAYYKMDGTQTVCLYHLGVFICDIPAHSLGSGGVIVAKTTLMVNMARNTVHQNCPVWTRIKRTFKARASTRITRSTSMTDAERMFVINRLITGEVALRDVANLRIFRLATGSWISFSSLFRSVAVMPVSFAEIGNRTADRSLQAKTALVLSSSMLEAFNCETPAQWHDLMNTIVENTPYAYREITVTPFSTIKEKYHEGAEIIPDKELTDIESIWIRALTRADRLCAGWQPPDGYAHSRPSGGYIPLRTFRVGVSDVADGWTDGETYIAINREFLRKLKDRSFSDCVKLAQLVVHEYCHHNDSSSGHVHDIEFYRDYHDLHELVARLAELILKGLTQTAVGRARGATRKTRTVIDSLAVLEHSISDIERHAAIQGELFSHIDACKKALRQAKRVVKKAGLSG